MSIKLRWYSGAYYNTAQIIESIKSSDKQYWGTAGSSLSYYCSPPSLLSFMSGESSMDPLSRFHRLKKENEINALEEEVIGRIAASTLLTKNQIIMYARMRKGVAISAIRIPVVILSQISFHFWTAVCMIHLRWGIEIIIAQRSLLCKNLKKGFKSTLYWTVTAVYFGHRK